MTVYLNSGRQATKNLIDLPTFALSKFRILLWFHHSAVKNKHSHQFTTKMQINWCCKKHKCCSDKSKPPWRLLYFISCVVPAVWSSVRPAQLYTLRLYQIPSCQISCHPDVICFITVLVGINDSGGVFHSSRCAATAAGCCQRLLEAEGKLPCLQTPSLSWPERCWLSCLFALPGRIKCLLLRWCKFFYYDAFQQP